MVGGETHLTWSLRFSASSIKRLQRHPVLIGVQMFCSQVVVENKTQLRSPTQNFGQDVSVLKQLRTGVFFFFLLQGDKCAHKTTVSLRIHLLVIKYCHGTSYANSDSHSKCFREVSCFRHQESIIQRNCHNKLRLQTFFNPSARNTLPFCVTNQ